MSDRTSQKRRFAALLVVAVAFFGVTTHPGAHGVDWPLVIAISVAGLFAAALAVLTLWLVGRPIIGWWFDRRTSS